MPGSARFSLDLWAGEDDRLMIFEHELKVDFAKITKNEAVDDLNKSGTIGRECTVEWTLDAPSEAITFDEDCIRCVDESAKELFGDGNEKLTLISEAGQYGFPNPRSFCISLFRDSTFVFPEPSSSIERATANNGLN